MYDLTDNLCGLSPKRQEKIADLCFIERQDAALNSVVLGLKSMNQVYGFGLKRLSNLSVSWGNDITAFYKAGGLLYHEYPEGGVDALTGAGNVLCDVDSIFRDLSPRRRREIWKFLYDQRKDAQFNAAMIGLDTIRRELHFGDSRMEHLTNQWEYDIRDFYQDREDQEPRLQEWIEEIGFIFENGHLQAYRCKQDDRVVRKRTAEKWFQEDNEA